ncbi:MAG: hypothetical protein JWO52_6281 [Gammaproteobacteria bacterium]|nr:hypothetical protein [Gammaproteobacteria bacterium]
MAATCGGAGADCDIATVHRRQRLGGMLNYYYRAAASMASILFLDRTRWRCRCMTCKRNEEHARWWSPVVSKWGRLSSKDNAPGKFL